MTIQRREQAINSKKFITDLNKLLSVQNLEDAMYLIQMSNVDINANNQEIAEAMAKYLKGDLAVKGIMEIEKLGANPFSRGSPFKQSLINNNVSLINYFMEGNILTKLSKETVYFINSSLQSESHEAFATLVKSVNVEDFLLPNENNPSFFNTMIKRNNRVALDIIIKEGLVKDYWNREESVLLLESPNTTQEFKNFYIYKLSLYLNVASEDMRLEKIQVTNIRNELKILNKYYLDRELPILEHQLDVKVKNKNKI